MLNPLATNTRTEVQSCVCWSFCEVCLSWLDQIFDFRVLLKFWSEPGTTLDFAPKFFNYFFPVDSNKNAVFLVFQIALHCWDLFGFVRNGVLGPIWNTTTPLEGQQCRPRTFPHPALIFLVHSRFLLVMEVGPTKSSKFCLLKFFLQNSCFYWVQRVTENNTRIIIYVLEVARSRGPPKQVVFWTRLVRVFLFWCESYDLLMR